MRIATGTLVIIGLLMSANAASAPPAGTSGSNPQPRICPVSGCAGVPLGPLGDHIATPRYKIDISWSGISDDGYTRLGFFLHAKSMQAKHEFVQAVPDSKQFPEFANRQLQLRIDFKLVARTPRFMSVRETGMQDTGGAHPIPIDATFVFDTQAQRLISLDDLFTRPSAARKALADYARAELTNKIMAQAPKPGEGSPQAIAEWKTNAQKMIDDGTQPTQQNFANFIVRAGAQPNDASPGLKLIFPPYQVAPYVYGTQTVDVPDAVFAQYLQPRYRKAFAAP